MSLVTIVASRQQRLQVSAAPLWRMRAIIAASDAPALEFCLMSEGNYPKLQVDQFILDEIDSVPHLEALLLLWNRRPQRWSLEQMAKALYISREATEGILQDLKQRGMVGEDAAGYGYDPNFTEDLLMPDVDRIYRRELVRISRMIHSKASPAVREFARAFKFKKD